MRVLTVNRHTAYLYLLAKTGHNFYILGGEPWGVLAQRPKPENVFFISTTRKKFSSEYDVAIGHDPFSDLLTLGFNAFRNGIPYIQVIHGRLERTGYRRNPLRRLMKRVYADCVLGPLVRKKLIEVVFISPSVKASWNIPGNVIRPGIPVEEMGIYQGEVKALLVVGNDLHREHFHFDVLLNLMRIMPVRIVGRNPKIPEAQPANSWEELKELYACYRAYLNITREPEDGYNLATLEAMATGMPVLTLSHPTSPIIDGYNGLVASNFEELIEKAKLLLTDLQMSKRLGENARQVILRDFAIERFINEWNHLLRRVKK